VPLSRRDFIITGLASAVVRATADTSAFAQASADMSPRDLAALTLKEASELVRRRAASAVELTEACLARIDRNDRAINSFITVTRDQALAAARVG
jgi:hypothetical protein